MSMTPEEASVECSGNSEDQSVQEHVQACDPWFLHGFWTKLSSAAQALMRPARANGKSASRGLEKMPKRQKWRRVACGAGCRTHERPGGALGPPDSLVSDGSESPPLPGTGNRVPACAECS